MSAVEPIKVKGLVEFQAALRQLDGESQKQLRVALNEAADIVAASARRRVPVRTGRAAGTVRAMSSQREARVLGGSKKAPYYGWLDFGGRVGRKRGVRRPHLPAGRYIYPGYTANRVEVQTVLESALVELARRAGLEVS